MATIKVDQYLWQSQTAQNFFVLAPTFLDGKYTEMIFYVTFDHTSAAGQVVIETAYNPYYTGTWANVGTVNWSAIDKAHYVAVTGVFKALRVRIATAVTTGTCDVAMISSSISGA